MLNIVFSYRSKETTVSRCGTMEAAFHGMRPGIPIPEVGIEGPRRNPVDLRGQSRVQPLGQQRGSTG